MKGKPRILERIYIPKSGEPRNAYLVLLDVLGYCRYPTKADSHRIGVDVVLIETQGKGARETFRSFAITEANFGKVGEKMCEIAYRSSAKSCYVPARMSRDLGKILIFEKTN